MKTKLCGCRMPKSITGHPRRGLCSRITGHAGRHGNNSCQDCGIFLTSKTSASYVVKRRRGYCTKCQTRCSRRYKHQKTRQFKIPGKNYTFPCGCTGILPRRGQANKFTYVPSERDYGWCRIGQILMNGKKKADYEGYTPIDPKTPHAVIRTMMDKPDCVLCNQPLKWEFGRGKTPHLHHNHATGEIYGFSHARCNPNALEQEIYRLKKIITERV